MSCLWVAQVYVGVSIGRVGLPGLCQCCGQAHVVGGTKYPDTPGKRMQLAADLRQATLPVGQDA